MTDDKILDENAADALPQKDEASDDAPADETALDETAADNAAADELPAAAPAPVPEPVRYLFLDRVYRTRGIEPILPGTYKLNDAGLQGRGLYLLKNRIAFEVNGPDYVPASPDDDDADADPDPEFVLIEYVGANKSAHKVKARGIEYEVPRQTKGADGKPEPRYISVRADLAPEFLSRGTFAKGR